MRADDLDDQTIDIRQMLTDSATRLFADHVDANLMDRARDGEWPAQLWKVIDEAELPRISIPESSGGAGGTLSDLAAVLRIAGRCTAPVPLAETALMANWMLAECGLPVERGACTVGHGADLLATKSGGGVVVSGKLERVAWARGSARLVALARAGADPLVVVLDPAACTVTPGRNLAFEPRDSVTIENVPALAHAPAPQSVRNETLRLRGALGRSLLMAGALERALALAVEYAQNRVQFGRKIGQFQAIQQELARAAGEVAAAVAAAMSAAGAFDRDGAFLPVACAKIRTAQAAREVSLIAHQVHGAIGVTQEYPLHHATLRLMAWREEYGHEGEWAIELGRGVQKDGPHALWPSVTIA
jgi:acyl-CoA dehydrogenase